MMIYDPYAPSNMTLNIIEIKNIVVIQPPQNRGRESVTPTATVRGLKSLESRTIRQTTRSCYFFLPIRPTGFPLEDVPIFQSGSLDVHPHQHFHLPSRRSILNTTSSRQLHIDHFHRHLDSLESV
jgi:hypothetical protein